MVTIKDVSRRTGLSISTISKYINGGNVREENRALIDEAIRALGFKVNQAARSLKTNKTMKVGVLLPSLDVSFFGGIIAQVDARLSESGYTPIICSFDHSPIQEMRKLEFLIDQQVDGIIMVAQNLTAGQLNDFPALRNRSTPVVFLDRHIENLSADYVLADGREACFLATGQFIEKGHRRIGVITGPEYISTARDRLQGYLQALAQSDIAPDPELIKMGDYSINAGYALFSQLISMNSPPTAVLVTNHDMTVGAVTAAFEKKLSIPRDVSFIGYDDTQLTQIIRPPLTIVAQPTGQMAQETAALLLKRMRGDYGDFPRTLMLKSSLMVHESIKELNP